MTINELIKALQRLKVETRSIACLGCGHEHNCGIHGCAIIREAVQQIEGLLESERQLRKERTLPCVYYDHDGICTHDSEAEVTAFCVEGPCSEWRLSNGDCIRQMKDEELAVEILRHWRMEMEAVGVGDMALKWCDMAGGCISSKGYHRPCTEERILACIIRWLKAPNEEVKVDG